LEVGSVAQDRPDVATISATSPARLLLSR
jgi:hypothetical protein